jgi:hypothetical protein
VGGAAYTDLKARVEPELRDRVHVMAARLGVSQRDYIIRALEEQMARDGAAALERESLPALRALLESMEKSIERRQARVVGEVYGEVLRGQEFLRAYVSRTTDTSVAAALAQVADQAVRARVEKRV